MSNKALPSGASVGMNSAEEATARTLIMALIYRYASLAREDGDYSETAKLFEPNAMICFPDGRELPASDLGEITRSNPPKFLRHHLTTIDVQFDSPDEAHCQSYVIAGTDVKMPDHWGRWDDAVRRQSGGEWLLRTRSSL